MDGKQTRLESSEMRLSNPDLHTSAFSDTSSESGEDNILQKVNSWKILVTHLQKELHAEKVKTRGQSSIINSFNELKTESVKLKETLKQKNDAVTVLQNRLARLGADPSVRLGDGEFLLPGPSKQVLDSLAEENIQLKKSLKYVAVDPSRVDHLQKQLRVTEVDLSECRHKTKHLESENKRLNGLLTSSESAKDIEILKLQQQVRALEDSKDTQNILCQSLSDETEDMRFKLRDTVRQLQQLEQNLGAGRLYSGTQSKGQQGQNVGQVKHKVFDPSGVPNLTRSVSEQPEQSVSSLQTLVRKQEKEIREVNEMNMKWQKYNDQREEFVRKIQKKLSDVEDRLAKSQNAQSNSNDGGITEEQQAQIDRIILQCKRKVEVTEEEKLQIEEENRQLKTQLSAVQAEIKAKTEEITLLRGHVQVLSNRDSMSAGSFADKERIQLLEQQITVWRDDFKQERQDREKAVSRATKLESELHFVKRQLEQFQGQQLDDLALRRQQSLSNQERQYYGRYATQDMMSRGTQRNDLLDTDGGEDTVDSPMDFARHLVQSDISGVQHRLTQKDIGQSSLRMSSDKEELSQQDSLHSGGREEDTLECPNCHLVFPASEHFQLLDHINECC